MAVLLDELDSLHTFPFTPKYIRGVRRGPEILSDANSRCSADAQNIQPGFIQTHVPQSQPGEYVGKNEEDRYETSEDELLGVGELLSFGGRVAAMVDVSGEGVRGGKDGGGG